MVGITRNKTILKTNMKEMKMAPKHRNKKTSAWPSRHSVKTDFLQEIGAAAPNKDLKLYIWVWGIMFSSSIKTVFKKMGPKVILEHVGRKKK